MRLRFLTIFFFLFLWLSTHWHSGWLLSFCYYALTCCLCFYFGTGLHVAFLSWHAFWPTPLWISRVCIWSVTRWVLVFFSGFQNFTFALMRCHAESGVTALREGVKLAIIFTAAAFVVSPAQHKVFACGAVCFLMNCKHPYLRPI